MQLTEIITYNVHVTTQLSIYFDFSNVQMFKFQKGLNFDCKTIFYAS